MRTTGPRWCATALLLVLVTSCRDARRTADAGDSTARSAQTESTLPVHVVSVHEPGEWLAMLITGDDGWSPGERSLASGLAARGIPVVALDSRRYLSRRRSPQQVSQDVGRALVRFLTKWRRDSVLLVGQSRGADVMPFVVNRLPGDLRERVGLVALLGVAPWAGFQFHWRDLFLTTRRATDLPVLPELERLRGTPLVCVYSEEEKDSLCSRLDTTLATPVERGGGHGLRPDDASQVVGVIMDAMRGRD